MEGREGSMQCERVVKAGAQGGTCTGWPVRPPEFAASRKPFSQAGRKLGGMALPTISRANTKRSGSSSGSGSM